jgi:hypothetical protein
MPPIATPDTFELTTPDLPGYRFPCVVLPPNTGVSHPLGHDHDDRGIEVPKDWGSLWVQILDEDGNYLGGAATFAASEKSVMCDTIDVPMKHRCKGIATYLYDLAEEVFGVPADPSTLLSPEAEAFWAKRRSRKGSP